MKSTITSLSLFSALLFSITLSAQNVGIGEANPASKLSVKGNMAIGNNYTNVAAPANGAIIQGNTIIGNNASYYNTDRLTVASPNGFGVASYIPNGQTASGGIRTVGIYTQIEGAGGAGVLVDHYANTNHGGLFNSYGTNTTTALKGDSDRGITHGVMGENPYTSQGYAMYCNGNIYISNNVYGPSDQNLKQNIKTYTGGLATILALNPKSYQYKEDLKEKYRFAPGEQIGFLAQELEIVMPTLVKEGLLTSASNENRKGENYVAPESMTAKTVNYLGLIPVLTSAIQEQQAQIEQQAQLLQQQAQLLEALQAQNKLMQTQIDLLKQENSK